MKNKEMDLEATNPILRSRCVVLKKTGIGVKGEKGVGTGPYAWAHYLIAKRD